MRASTEWAARFADAECFGFVCGRRTGVTIVDIDANDESLLAAALEKWGDSPLIVMTHSGKFHIYYAYAGERRRIRPDRSVPIDILGDGGFVIAPPSVGASGSYRIIRGTLSDIPSLPPMRASQVRGSARADERDGREVRVGRRNETLFKECLREAANAQSLDQVLDFACRFNDSLADPLSTTEIGATAASAWRYTERGCNWVGHGGHITFTNEEIDHAMGLGADPFMLFALLRRRHWNRDFLVTNTMRRVMPGGSWAEKRFVKARNALLAAGKIRRIRSATKGTPALYRFEKGNIASQDGDAGSVASHC